MWIIIIAAVVAAIVFGIVGFVHDGIKECALCIVFGIVMGAGLGLAVSGLVSSSYSYNHDNCTSSTDMFNLMPYAFDDETYYAYMNGYHSFSVDAQYINKNGELCSVHLSGTGSCKFDKSATPSVMVTTYSPKPSKWILFPESHREYQLLLPNESVIYWNTK